MANNNKSAGVNRQKGAALILVLIALTTGSLLIIPTLNYVYTGLHQTRIREELLLEQYTADAGIELALWNLENFEITVPLDGQSELPPFTINDKTLDVTVENIDGQTYKITSTATSDGGSTTTVEVHVSGSATHAVMSTDPDEGLSWVRHNAVINGDVYYAGDYLIEDNAEINGSITQSDPFDLGCDPEEYKAEAQSWGTHAGSLTIDSSPYTLGPLYITGDLKIKEGMDVTLGGTVYVEGKIEIGKNDPVTITGTGNLVAANQNDASRAILIKNKVTIDLDNAAVIMVVYSPGEINGEIHVQDECDITGMLYNADGWVHVHASGPSYINGPLVGTSVKVCEDTVVTYNLDFYGFPGLAPYGWSIQGWQIN
jgi:hypothetical protein